MKYGIHTKIWHREKSVLLNCFIGDYCVVHAPCWIGNGVVIGNRCRIQAFAFIPERVIIGNDVFIGPHVTFTNDIEPPSYGKRWADIVVGDGAVIGAGAVIRAGVTLAPGSRVGCGAVVIEDVKDNEWVVGNPAKPIRR